MTTNGNNPVNLEAGGATEAVRIDQQNRLKNRIISSKTYLTEDVKNLKAKIELFEATFQIEDAINIIQVYSYAKAGFKYLESVTEELRELICDTHEAEEEEIQRDVDELDADLDLYKGMLLEIKKNHKNILEKCESGIQTKATDNTSIKLNRTNTPSNKSKQKNNTNHH